MIRYKEAKCIDVTAKKSNKIEYLQRMVNNASTVVAMANSKYNSFVDKAATFTLLYNESENDLAIAEGYVKQFLQVKSDLQALNETASEANLVAVDAFHDIKLLICEWEDVTSESLKAAEAITLTANYIQKRKASNPLISSDLVNDAIAASNAAQKTVSRVVKAFTDALAALSSSRQANNTSELTSVYINLAIATLLDKNVKEQIVKYKQHRPNIEDNPLFTQAEVDRTIYKRLKEQKSLEVSLMTALNKANEKTKLALNASDAANKEMNLAKEELAQAQAALSTWNAALVAANTAIAG